MAQTVKRLLAMREAQVRFLGREDPLEKEMAIHSTPALLPGKSHGRRRLIGYSPWGRKESDTTERLHLHFHFSVCFRQSRLGVEEAGNPELPTGAGKKKSNQLSLL